jgi:hypothetical protein
MLDINIRGSLDLIIDQMVGYLPTTVTFLREGERKASLHIDSEKDYTLGYAHGAIKASFLAIFISLKSRPPNPDETKEVDTIIYNRTDELRNAIFRGG